MADIEKMRQEAIRRLEALDKAFGLGPKLVNYFKEGRLYYSYGYSMDTITYDPSYAAAVKEFERKYNALVYHAVEAETGLGTMLSFLYVSSHEEEWKDVEELTAKGQIFSYTYIVSAGPDNGDFGDIKLASPLGYLMRIG